MEQVLVALIHTSPWYIIIYLLYRAITALYRNCVSLTNGNNMRDVAGNITRLVTTRVESEQGNVDIILSLQDIVRDVLGNVKQMVNNTNDINQYIGAVRDK